jgi:ABC-type transport system involved in multi-copper enzyme maturation permease subunit
MSLYKAETRRLLKRRFVRYLVIGALVILGAVAAGMFFTNQHVGPAQVAQARQEAERQYQDQVKASEQDKIRCEQDKAAGAVEQDRWPANCADVYIPQREEFRAEWNMPATFEFRKEFGDMVTTFAAIIALVAFVIGASFIGAEWNSGGMMNLLLWRPQRLKVLGTKLAALLAGITALSVLAGAAWTGLFWLIAEVHGTTEKMTSGAWQSFGLTGLRALALILTAGALGFGLASLGRHTAVALGVAAGVGVVAQFAIGIVLSLAEVKFQEAYLLPTYALAWMSKKVTLEDYKSCDFSGYGGCEPPTMDITWPMAGGLGLAAVVVVLGAAMWTMRRRDIT